MNRTERLRRRYRPETISALFVGESAPAGGRFFYDEDNPSRLRGFTEAVMRTELGERIGADFLSSFQRLGFYLDDLCQAPVNHLEPKPRGAACRACEPDLAIRIAAASPRIVIGISVTRRRNFQRALKGSGATAPLEVLTFPNRPEQVAAYRNQLADLIRRLDQKSLFLA
jgi:hypothetical protein